ncbi:EAL domain-containing protein [Paucibacter sp. B2R-40]|uniref:bifunctional diguanylate cyclase/phosphodiesterase n=1 Tax=Paucibacter sp. B2R-40 TaxID=2893554 RepID=UPI0021E40A21|nr:GGDEF domain-containing phosphodiesterase [Paucibacter sp. B2R-40]MCV2354266.1 EAL domain-containing protein [Paucibacter sp. B2R-40]
MDELTFKLDSGSIDQPRLAKRQLESLRLLATLLACLAGGALGQLSLGLLPHTALFWPPAGIALAALTCWGWGMTAPLLLGLLALGLLQGASLSLAVLLALSGLLGPAMALLLMRRLGYGAAPRRRTDLPLLLVVGVLGGALMSALAGVSALLLQDQLQVGMWRDALSSGFGGQALGALTLAPALVHWQGQLQSRQQCQLAQAGGSAWRRGSAHWAGSVALMLACGGSAALIFVNAQTAVTGLSPWLLLPLLLLSGLALLGSLAATAGAAFLITLSAAAAAAQACGPFRQLPLQQSLALLWGFSGSAAALPLLIHSLRSELHSERQRWRGALESAGMSLAEWQLGPTGSRQTYASTDWHNRIGAFTERSGRPQDCLAAAHPLDKDRVSAALDALLNRRQTGESVQAACCEPLRLAGHAADWSWFELRAHVQQRDAKGLATRLLMTLTDVSWRHTAQERQRMSVSLFQHLHEGLLVTDTEHLVLDANPSYCRMLGLSREALIGRPAAPLQSLSLHRSGLTPAQVQYALQSQGFWQGQVQTERADGSRCHLQVTVSSIPEPDGPLRYQVVSVSDLTETLSQQDLLQTRARVDPLTGLANADAFMQMLRQGLEMAGREGFRLSICRVDLDQFKLVNSQYGSAVADALLQLVGQRLQAALRSSPQWSDCLARLGGDEFGLLLRSNSPEEAQLAMERLLKVLAEPYLTRKDAAPTGETMTINISASIGATLFPQDNSDAETLLRHAGHALYRVKHSGRHGYQLFDTAKRLRDEASLIALARVQQALDAGELRLFYQPKIDMNSGLVLGMEALLRWQHPDRGLLAPLHFLPLIESTGLGVQVGDWVLEQALRQSSRWLKAGLRLNISVNVTARQLQMPDFTQRLQELIKRHQEPVAAHLCLEVLESAALADIATTHSLIQQCRAFGVRFALDDFGTGYSTLTYLKRLPVDVLKIDRSFVQNMLIDAQDSTLVEGVIRLAGNFGCSVIAEGVESAAHARALLRLGCEQGQGNGIAPAMPAAEVQGWVGEFANSKWLTQMSGAAPALP